MLRREQGRLDEVADLVRRSAEQHQTYPIWRCVHAQTAAALGLEREARSALASMFEDDVPALPFDEEWLVGVSLLAETAQALGDARRAPALYVPLLTYEDRIAVSYPEISTGAIARPLSLLATTLGRWEDAERHFEAALEHNGRMGALPWVAHTTADHARMLLARGEHGDRAAASTLAGDACAGYRDLGMAAHAARASELRERARGGERSPRP